MAKENKSVKNFPNLRFPGFEGEWRFTNLGNCAYSFEYGMNASAIKFDGENRYIRITDIDEASSKYKPEFPVSPNGQLLDKYLVSENDILFARTGASTGKSYLYHKDDGKLYFAGFLIRAKIKEEFNSYFVFTQTKTIHYYKWVQLMSMRSGQPGINLQEYACYSFHIPSKKEQDKIASFLLFVDERIQTQKKIIEQLKTLMKASREKIFSKKLRFKNENNDFYSEWKSTKLKNISQIFDGTHQTPKYVKKGVPFYSVENLTANNFSVTKYISEEVFIKENNRVKIEKGDILMTRIGDIGTVKYIDWNVNASFYVSLALIKSNNDNNSKYLAQYISSDKFQNELWNRTIHVAFPKKINLGEIGECLLKIPCIEEQTKIANFLSSIQEKIETEKQILEKLEQQKKFLMANLFV